MFGSRGLPVAFRSFVVTALAVAEVVVDRDFDRP